MTNNTYLDHLNQRLQTLVRDMAKARKKLEDGSIEDKVTALGDLTRVELKHQELAKKIEAATKKNAEDWSTLHMGFQEDLDALAETLESWIMKYT